MQANYLSYFPAITRRTILRSRPSCPCRSFKCESENAIVDATSIFRAYFAVNVKGGRIAIDVLTAEKSTRGAQLRRNDCAAKRCILNPAFDDDIWPVRRKIEVSGTFKGYFPAYRLALRMTSRASSLLRSIATLSKPLKRKRRSSCTLHLQASEYAWQLFEPPRYRRDAGIRSLTYPFVCALPAFLAKVRTNAPDWEVYRVSPPLCHLCIPSTSSGGVMIICRYENWKTRYLAWIFAFWNRQNFFCSRWANVILHLTSMSITMWLTIRRRNISSSLRVLIACARNDYYKIEYRCTFCRIYLLSLNFFFPFFDLIFFFLVTGFARMRLNISHNNSYLSLRAQRFALISLRAPPLLANEVTEINLLLSFFAITLFLYAVDAGRWCILYIYIFFTIKKRKRFLRIVKRLWVSIRKLSE